MVPEFPLPGAHCDARAAQNDDLDASRLPGEQAGGGVPEPRLPRGGARGSGGTNRATNRLTLSSS
jgi:hypothetical protein